MGALELGASRGRLPGGGIPGREGYCRRKVEPKRDPVVGGSSAPPECGGGGAAVLDLRTCVPYVPLLPPQDDAALVGFQGCRSEHGAPPGGATGQWFQLPPCLGLERPRGRAPLRGPGCRPCPAGGPRPINSPTNCVSGRRPVRCCWGPRPREGGHLRQAPSRVPATPAPLGRERLFLAGPWPRPFYSPGRCQGVLFPREA